jgi:hypothetical protein
MTTVNENARLELLRTLASYRDFRATGAGANCQEYVPLFCTEFVNPREDVLLAATEASKIGQISLDHFDNDPMGRAVEALQGPVVCITDEGYDWIRARDLLGEDAQETASRRPEKPA